MELFAKSPWPDGRHKRLADHNRETMEAAVRIFGTIGTPSRLLAAWLRFFRLPSAESSRFLATLFVACGFHDLGKANSGFAGMLTRRGEQVIRHEHLSALLLLSDGVEQWLASNGDVDFDAVLSAVAGHHLKSSARDEGPRARCQKFGSPMGEGRTFEVHSLEPDFSSTFENVAMQLGLQPFVVPKIQRLWSLGGPGQDVHALSETLTRRFTAVDRSLRKKPERQRFFAAIKSAMIICDTASSGVIREMNDLGWLDGLFGETAVLEPDRIDEIISRRVVEIGKKRTFVWQDFQVSAESLGPRALLLAGCGSGKTLAAWRWIRARVAERAVSRVIFLYPTRATATEGFRDYVSWAPEDDGALLHGTASFDLQGMFTNPDDRRTEGCYEPDDRLYAMGYWDRRVFSATIDQFLGFMRQSYRSICLLPLLVDSVIVVDEVHSFDRDLFASLRRFLREFDVPVLCMTASLTQRRRDELAGIGLEIFPSAGQFEDLESKTTAPRYRVRRLTDPGQAVEIAGDRFTKGKRVLIVVNTIARCQRLAARLGALCYHSGFKLQDRREHHQAVVAAFQQSDVAALAVTTQVCEMSLDLDADVLLTEEAPITSLIQRMGRCNRQGSSHRGEVFVYKADSELPYSRDDLKGVEQFVAALQSEDVSQARLETLLLEYGPSPPELDRYERFLDDGPWAVGGYDDLREIEEIGVRAILDTDVEEFRRLARTRKPVDGLLLKVNKHNATKDPSSAWLHIAPSGRYTKSFGFWNGKEALL